MKIWLDDVRTPPNETWKWCKNVYECIGVLLMGNVTHISFDHDLGTPFEDEKANEHNTGYWLAKQIEMWLYEDFEDGWKLPFLTWDIHSANPVGRRNIEMAMKNADKYWNLHKQNP